MIKELIFESIFCLYVIPLTINAMIFIMCRSENNNTFPIKKALLLNFIPVYNTIVFFIIAYTMLKEWGHQFFADKKQHKYAIGLIILTVSLIIYAFFHSVLSGIIFTVFMIIMFYIMIKG